MTTISHAQEIIVGLSIYVGIFFIPWGRSWFEIVAKLMESNRHSLLKKSTISWLLLAKTLSLTLLLIFIGFNWQLATRETAISYANLGIYPSTLLGFGCGFLLWAVYAVAFRILKPDWRSFYKKYTSQRLIDS